MALPKAPYSYEMALAQQPKGFHYVCAGCKETVTVYPKGAPFTHTCWCGSAKQFTGSEVNATTV